MTRKEYLCASRLARNILKGLGLPIGNKIEMNKVLKAETPSQGYYLASDKSEYIILNPRFEPSGLELKGLHAIYYDKRKCSCVYVDLLGDSLEKIQANLRHILSGANARCLERG